VTKKIPKRWYVVLTEAMQFDGIVQLTEAQVEDYEQKGYIVLAVGAGTEVD
jgi:hypothetical protein